MLVAIHRDIARLRGAPTSTSLFCWVCMGATRGTFWPVYRRIRIMLVPVGPSEHLCNEVECEGCGSLYKLDIHEEPRTQDQFPHAEALLAHVQAGTLDDATKAQVLARAFIDLRHMLWHNVNHGRTETGNTLLLALLMPFLIATPIVWYTYFDPRGGSNTLLAVAITLTAFTSLFTAWLIYRTVRRNAHALRSDVLHRLVTAANHLRPSELAIRGALVEVAKVDAAYAKDLSAAKIVERILNSGDTLLS